MLAIVFGQIGADDVDLDSFRFLVGDHGKTNDSMAKFEVEYYATVSSGSPTKVEFEIGNETAVAELAIPQGNRWSASIDMSSVSLDTDQLVVRAYENGGPSPTETFRTIHMDPVPDWMQESNVEYAASATTSGGYVFDVFITDVEQGFSTPNEDSWWFLKDRWTGFRMGPVFDVVSSPDGSVHTEDLGYLMQGVLLGYSVFEVVMPTHATASWELTNLNNLASGQSPGAQFDSAGWGDVFSIERVSDEQLGKPEHGWYIEGSLAGGVSLEDNLEFHSFDVTADVLLAHKSKIKDKAPLKIEFETPNLPLFGAVGVPPGVLDLVFVGTAEVSGGVRASVTASASDDGHGGLEYGVSQFYLQPTLEFKLGGAAELQVANGLFTPLAGRITGEIEQSLVCAYWTGGGLPQWFTAKTASDMNTGWNFFAPGSLDLTAEVYTSGGWGDWKPEVTWWSNTWDIAEWDLLGGADPPDDTGAKGVYDHNEGTYFVSNLQDSFIAQLTESGDQYGFYMPEQFVTPATVRLSDPTGAGLRVEVVDLNDNVLVTGAAGADVDLSAVPAGPYFVRVVGGAAGTEYTLAFDIEYDREGASVVSVIDRSGSMGGSNIAAARAAANIFVGLMHPGDRIGIVSFNDEAQVNYPLTLIDPSEKQTADAQAAINRLGAGGGTFIGGGIQLAVDQLQRYPDDPARAVIAMTDGRDGAAATTRNIVMNNVPEDVRLFTIGFGGGADMNFLTELAQYRNGHSYYAPTDHELLEVYLDIVSAWVQTPLMKWEGTLNASSSSPAIAMQSADDSAPGDSGPQLAMTAEPALASAAADSAVKWVYVDPGVRTASFACTWSGGDLDMILVDPLGNVLPRSSQPGTEFEETDSGEFYQVDYPTPGLWEVRVVGVNVPRDDFPFTVRVFADAGPLKTELLSTFGQYEAGTPVPMQIQVEEAGFPVPDLFVAATITPPAGSGQDPFDVLLRDDGTEGDATAGDGIYSGLFAKTYWGGEYEADLQVFGFSNLGYVFTRQFGDAFTVTGDYVEPLRVADVDISPGGFVATFNNPIDPAVLNLYQTQETSWEPVDATLVGQATGDVAGSLIVDATSVRFVATDGTLAPDDYTLVLRSADDAFKGLEFGQLLDGEYSGTFPSGDDTPGGDFVYTFTVDSPEPIVVSLPDFARGPGQPVNLEPIVGENVVNFGLPFEPGAQWEYERTDNDGNAVSWDWNIADEPVEYNGNQCLDWRMAVDDQYYQSMYLTMDSAGAWAHGHTYSLAGNSEERIVAPSALWLRSAMVPGVVYTDTSNITGHSSFLFDDHPYTGAVTYSSTLLSDSSVSVTIPAGTFDAWEVAMENERTLTTDLGTTTYFEEGTAWFVDGIGVIKYEGSFRWDGDYQEPESDYRFELQTHNLPDTSEPDDRGTSLVGFVGSEQPDAGMSVMLSNGAGVTSAYLRVSYDPDLLTVTGARLGPDAPEGTMVSANLETPGEVTLAFFSLTPLWSGPAQIIRLDAVVPAGAAYGAAHVLDIADLELNAGALTATDDDALHVVAFMGDANRDQRFDTEDARLISRVGMGFDSGFEQYPTIDPMIIADLTGDGTISPLDCSHLMEEIVGLDSEYVPPMPVVENAEPTADDQEVTTDEDTAIIIQLTGDDGDPEVVQNLTFATTDPANGTLSGFDPATGTVTYTPAAGFNGTDTFTFTVTDDDQAGPTEDLTSPAATVTISVNPVNDRPTADPQSVSVPENGSEAIALTGDDGDSEVTQVLTYVITDQPDFGALTPPNQATGEVTYTPLGGYVGPDSFAFMVIDDNQAGSPPGLMSAEATVSITVVDVNDAPTFTASDPAAVDEDAGAQSVGGWATFDPGSPSESGQSVLQYTVSNVSNPALFAVAPSVGDDGTLTYTPADDAWGTSTFDVTVQDDGGTAHGGVDTSATQTFTITVGAVNDEPTLTASDPPAVGEDSGAQSVAGWPTFDPGSPSESSQSVLQYIVSNVSNAALFAVAPSVANDGTLTYTPADDAWGTSTFDVTVQDDGGTSNGGDDTSPPRTFTIVVNAVNDGPENHVPGLQTTPQNQTLVFSAASGNQIWITDPDAGSGVVEVSLTAEHGLLSLYSMMGTMAVVNAALDGLTFTPDPDYVGDASIEITTDDRGNIGSGGAVTDTDSIPITVESASPLVAAELPANVVSQVTGMAESYPSTPQTVGLTDDVLQPIVTEAVSRWVNAGLDGRVLEELRVTRTAITDLPGSELGLAAGPTIVIDQDAAGHGWFVDPTPSQDEEFSVAEGGELRAITPDAASTMDLLTVVEHELGHVTGLTDGPAGTADVMSATLPVGVRRVPSAADMTISSLESPEPALGAGLQAAPVPVETDFAPVAAAKWSFTGVENLMPQQSVNESVVSILETGSPLPANLDFGITFQTSGTREEWSSRWADALLIFDYKSPADYKFAGAFVGINTWAVGRMTERGYVLERTASEELDFGKDYRLQLHITGKSVCLAADGVEKLRFTFTDDLQSGDLGISTWKGSTRFDALAVEQV